MSKTQWTGRRSPARGAIIMNDESTARVVLEDWPHDYYDIDDDEAEGWIIDEADVEIAAEYLYAAAHEN
jgi:hypothetical protein|nr:MAG TPA: hypothetical protein [Caudoviricetes sp.]